MSEGRLFDYKGKPLSGDTHLIVGADGLFYARSWHPEDLWGFSALGCLSIGLDANGTIRRLLSETRPYLPDPGHHTLALLGLASHSVDLEAIECNFWQKEFYRFKGTAQQYLEELIHHVPPSLDLFRLASEAVMRPEAQSPSTELALGSPLHLARFENVPRGKRVGNTLSWAGGVLVKGRPELLKTLWNAINRRLADEDVPLDELFLYAAGVMGEDWPDYDKVAALALIELLAMSPSASEETVMELLGHPGAAARRGDRPMLVRPEQGLVLTPNISPDIAACWHRRMHLSESQRAGFEMDARGAVISAGVPMNMQSRAAERIEKFLIVVQAVLPDSITVQSHRVQVGYNQKETRWETQSPPTAQALALRQEVSLCLLKADLERDGVPGPAIVGLENKLRRQLNLSESMFTPESWVDEAVALFGNRSFVPPMPTKMFSNESMYAWPVQADSVQLLTEKQREMARVTIRDGRVVWGTRDGSFEGGALVFASDGTIYALRSGGIPRTPDEFTLLGAGAVAEIDLSYWRGPLALSTERRNYDPSSHYRVLALLKLAREGLDLANCNFTPFGHSRQMDRHMAAYRDDAPTSAQTVNGFLDDVLSELLELGLRTPLDAITWLLLQQRAKILEIPRSD